MFRRIMAVFILQTNYPSRHIMRRTFNATSIRTENFIDESVTAKKLTLKCI